MDLKDIPDRWKKLNVENPPYRYFPNRTRKQTLVYSWLGLIGFTAIGYLLAEVIDRHNESKEEMWKEYARTHMTFAHATVNKNQQDAFRDILMKARRQRLGLPPEAPGSVEIKDPFE
mmetsp:Transcript_5843/g.10542  ORF Transcript_5843/g.10542 Transcript_5843/m.10542 type:complete len:117 (+) Transcript_5843:71-421(+)